MTDRSAHRKGGSRQDTIFLSAPGVRCVVETDSIVLIQPGSRSLRLTGAAAALWALVVGGRGAMRIQEMMEAISGEDPATTEAWIERLLVRWEEQGYLAREYQDG